MRPSFHQMLKLSFLLLLSLLWACVTEDPNIIDNKLLSPNSISLESPKVPPFTLRNPTFKVEGVSANQTVKLFSDSQCQNIVGTKISSSTSVSITTDDLSFGTNTIYASVSDASGKSSLCSSSFATYTLVSFPKITGIQDLNVSMNEDESKSIPFTAVDEDDPRFGCSSVGVSSSNLSLFLSGSISGTGTNCILTLNPIKDQSGEGTITLEAKEGSYVDSKELKLTVNPLPDPPLIVLSKLALTFLEDRPSEQIILTISDPDPDAIMNCNQISFIPSSIVDVAISGSAPGCVATIKPKLNQTGPEKILFTVNNGLTDSESLDITIIPDPDPPEITLSKDSLTMIEDQTSSETFNVKVFDPDSEISCSNLSLSSSTLVNSVSGGSAPNCTLTLNPKLNQNGTENLIVTFKNDLEVTAPFSLIVTPDDDAPKIELSKNYISFTEDDEAKPLVVTVSDVDDENINCSQVSVSGDTAFLDPISVPSTSSPCNFSLKPKGDTFGIGKKITFTVDNGKPDSKVLSFDIARVDCGPIISLQSPSLSFKEDESEQFVTVTISDKDSEINCTKLSVVSSKDLVILGTPTPLPGGTTNSTDCSVSVKPKLDAVGVGDLTFTVDTELEAAVEMSFSITPEEDAPTIEIVTPAFSFKEDESGKLVSLKIDDKDSPVSCTNVSVSPNSLLTISDITGTDKNCSLILTPKKDDFGEVDLTFTVNNGLEGRVTRNIKVEAVNDDPVILINNNSLSFEEDGALERIELTLSDIDSEVSCSQVSASTSDLVSSKLLTTTGKVCAVDITPKENQDGSGDVIFTVNNGLVATTKLSISISSDDDAPKIELSSSPLNFVEDGALQTIQISLSDVDSEINCSQLSVSSPEHVTVLRVSNSGKMCDVTVKPVLDKYGTGDIIFTATNTKTVTQKLAYTVSPVDDAPVISLDKSSLSFSEDGIAQTVKISISDVDDETLNCSNVRVLENSLVSLGAVNVSGSDCSVTVTPVKDLDGSSTLTFKVLNTLSSEALLNFKINPEDDAPVAKDIFATISEDITTTVSLDYTDVEKDKASECILSNLNNLSGDCNCDTTGLCTASVKGTLNFNGAASFSYIVKANGKPSNAATATITISPSDDAPVAKDIFATISEDITTTVNLDYSDIENHQATICTLSSLSNLTQIDSCECISGKCRVNIKGTTNFNGSASFYYTVRANELVSLSAFATITVSPVNDLPEINIISGPITDEDIAKDIAFTIRDVESSLNCVNSVSVSSSSPVSNVVISGIAPDCNLKVTPVANLHGSSTITLTVSDGTDSAVRSFVFTINPVNDPFVASGKSYELTPWGSELTVDLPYTDLEKDSATICEISSPVNLIRTKDCLCSSGKCSTSFKGNISIAGTGTFNYRVGTSLTDLSTYAVGTISIRASRPNLSYSSSSGNKDTYFQKEPSILQSNGSSVTCSASSLPPGLSINPTSCVIFGTPTTVAGATNYTITATNFAAPYSTPISITINPSPYIILANFSGYRAWSDGTFAKNCSEYRYPTLPYQYSGATGNSTYRIDPDGSGPTAPFNVTCDMVNNGTTIVSLANFSILKGYLTDCGLSQQPFSNKVLNCALTVDVGGGKLWKLVTKSSTNELWLDNISGMVWSPFQGCINWNWAVSHCSSLSSYGITGETWKLPSRNDFTTAQTNGLFNFIKTSYWEYSHSGCFAAWTSEEKTSTSAHVLFWDEFKFGSDSKTYNSTVHCIFNSRD